MPVTNTQKQQLTAATIAMFGVPMGGYSAWLQGQLEAANGNLQTVLDQLATIDYFKTIYSGDNATVATKLAATYGFTSVTGGLGQSVKTLFQNSLDAGASVAALINTANNFLLTNTDPTYADARNLLLNKVAVATFYTDNMQGNSQDLGALSKVLAGVGVSQDTVLTAQQQLVLALGSNGIYNPTIKALTSGADNVAGTNDKDAIDGLTGDDTIQGGDGADHLLGSAGNDKLYGERGADWLEGGTGSDRLEAGSYYAGGYVNGVYTTTYDATTNVLQGGDGADTLIGGYGADVLDGGTGADLIYGEEYTFNTDGMSADKLALLFNDTIYGGDGADTIYGGGGQDWIDAGTGADTVYMPSGGGYANGGEGDDYLVASYGNDTLMGGAGNDTLINSSYSTTGDDLFDGGDGNDTITAAASTNNTITILGGTGHDKVVLTSVYGKGFVTLGEGSDSVQLGKGLYTIDLSENTSMTDAVIVDGLYPGDTDTTTISTVKGFNPTADLLNVGYVNLWGSVSYPTAADSGYVKDYYTQVVTANYVQKISSPSTPFKGPTGYSSTYANGITTYNPDYAGKGIFVITGASASAADSATVAQFLNPYGNNATYVTGSTYYFVVDVVGQGAGLYMFKDDSNGDNNIVGDELSPIVLLTGVNAADLSYLNFI